MTITQEGKTRAQMLKEVRGEHAETVARTQDHLKEQQKIRKVIKNVLKEGPLTVPSIAAQADLPPDQVLYHIVTMKKYDQVVEVGQDGEYYQYELVKEKKS